AFRAENDLKLDLSTLPADQLLILDRTEGSGGDKIYVERFAKKLLQCASDAGVPELPKQKLEFMTRNGIGPLSYNDAVALFAWADKYARQLETSKPEVAKALAILAII